MADYFSKKMGEWKSQDKDRFDMMDMSNKSSKTIAYFFPTIADLFWMAAFFGVLLHGRRTMNADGDFALHLSMGRYILAQGRIPLEDVFSHALAGQPVVQHKWLGQLLFALAERIFGYGGIILLCALVIATAFWLVFIHASRDGKALIPVVIIVTLSTVASMLHWLIRPHVFTFLFLAAWMMLLDKLRKGELKCWWVLPALMVLWVNLHGGFIAGFMTWLIFGIGVGWDALWGRINTVNVLPVKFWRFYLLAGVTALGASLLNPSGIDLWRMIVTHLGNQYLAAITQEFLSPNFHKPDFWPFLFMIGLMVMLVELGKKEIDSGLLFNAVAWLFMGLYSVRNIPLFAIVSAPLLVKGLDELFANAAARFGVVNRIKQTDVRIQNIDAQLKGFVWPVVSIMLVVLGLGLGLHFDIQGQGYDFDPEAFPIEAVDWLQENPQEGEMFNSFLWGGYLQYRLWPEKRVFIDSNSDFYGEAFVRQYMQVIILQKGWEGVLDQYDVAWAILPLDERAAKAIQMELGWSIIYEDDTAVILRKK